MTTNNEKLKTPIRKTPEGLRKSLPLEAFGGNSYYHVYDIEGFKPLLNMDAKELFEYASTVDYENTQTTTTNGVDVLLGTWKKHIEYLEQNIIIEVKKDPKNPKNLQELADTINGLEKLREKFWSLRREQEQGKDENEDDAHGCYGPT